MFDRFEAALTDPTSAEERLVELVRQMESEGRRQVEIYDAFEQFYLFLRESEREADEERITDIMGRIIGWCGPPAKLFEHFLTNEEITSCGQSLARNLSPDNPPPKA